MQILKKYLKAGISCSVKNEKIKKWESLSLKSKALLIEYVNNMLDGKIDVEKTLELHRLNLFVSDVPEEIRNVYCKNK